MGSQTLVLFDIDGTLLTTGGAGRQALDAAFAALHGWEQATRHVDLSGATDGWIMDRVSDRFGAFDRPALQQRYYAELRARLTPGRASALPGVHAAVRACADRARAGLLTGNWRAGAELKLSAVGLWWEAPGAFGDDHTDRDALCPIARRRAEAEWGAVDRVIVIGDTPKDVACARAGGALAVAVRTGFASPESLEAARPDLLIDDLASGLPALLALLD